MKIIIVEKKKIHVIDAEEDAIIMSGNVSWSTAEFMALNLRPGAICFRYSKADRLGKTRNGKPAKVK